MCNLVGKEKVAAFLEDICHFYFGCSMSKEKHFLNFLLGVHSVILIIEINQLANLSNLQCDIPLRYVFAGLLDSCGLKPAVSRSASQRLLITSKPMPPIQSIPTSPETNRADESEQRALENGTDCLEVGGNHLKSTTGPPQVQSTRPMLICSVVCAWEICELERVKDLG